MTRVIKIDSVGKERNRLLKSIVVAIRTLGKQKQIDANTRDLVAYIALALIRISQNIDKTVEPWEKRGYWVKADQFRMQWDWTGLFGKKLLLALMAEDWEEIATIIAIIGEKLSNVKVSEKHRLGTPWIGAWDKLSISDHENLGSN